MIVLTINGQRLVVTESMEIQKSRTFFAGGFEPNSMELLTNNFKRERHGGVLDLEKKWDIMGCCDGRIKKNSWHWLLISFKVFAKPMWWKWVASPHAWHDFGNLHDLALGDLFVNCYVPRAPIIYHHGASILAQISQAQRWQTSFLSIVQASIWNFLRMVDKKKH